MKAFQSLWGHKLDCPPLVQQGQQRKEVWLRTSGPWKVGKLPQWCRVTPRLPQTRWLNPRRREQTLGMPQETPAWPCVPRGEASRQPLPSTHTSPRQGQLSGRESERRHGAQAAHPTPLSFSNLPAAERTPGSPGKETSSAPASGAAPPSSPHLCLWHGRPAQNEHRRAAGSLREGLGRAAHSRSGQTALLPGHRLSR